MRRKIVLILFSSYFFLSCNKNDDLDPIITVIQTQASMQNVASSKTEIDLSWTSIGNTSQLKHYKVEYSLHHGPWVRLPIEISNTETTIHLSLPDTNFYLGNSYAWRVVGVGQTTETLSCYLETMIPMDFGLSLPSTGFNKNTMMYLNFTTSNQGIFEAGIHPVIEELQGSQWVQIVDNSSNVVKKDGLVYLPQVFTANNTYRIKLHGREVYYGVNTNYIVFTYVSPPRDSCNPISAWPV